MIEPAKPLRAEPPQTLLNCNLSTNGSAVNPVLRPTQVRRRRRPAHPLIHLINGGENAYKALTKR